uniref:Uncharacterized protein n=1 Tax=Kalanchoe fedtschenkoi TaxID=63787 RepID=A0A7N0TGD1_KALFE
MFSRSLSLQKMLDHNLMSKPLIEMVRKQYIPAISTSSYSSISLLKHSAPIKNPGCNLKYVTRDGRESESISSSKVSSSLSVTPSLHSEKELLQAFNSKSFTLVDLRPATKDADSVFGEAGFRSVFKGWVDEKTLAASKPGTWHGHCHQKTRPRELPRSEGVTG